MSKTIVITGAGTGLGRTLAKRFAADGDSVVLLGRTVSKLEEAVAEIGDRAMCVQCDVVSPDSVRAAFAKIAERHPKIDVLINNAAIFQFAQVAEASDEHILGTIATNLTGPILCSRAAIPLMGRGGHIISVSSESVDMPFAMLSLYQATKAGLERFSLSLERELEASGIRATIIRCGQMMGENVNLNFDPAAGMAFHKANLERGIDVSARPLSNYASVADIFRAMIDLPPDLQVSSVQMHGRGSR